MQNLLLRHCREKCRLTEEKTAARAGMSPARYRRLEAGEGLMSTMESEMLGPVLKAKPDYLWQSSAQLESLAVAQELVQLHKDKIRFITAPAQGR
jgi:transcriptional regulator with XRE-family HTH domain